MSKASSKSVDPDLRVLAKEEVEPFHYEKMMANVKSHFNKENNKMTLLKKTSIATGIVITLMLALVLIPASYSVTVGSLVEADFMMPSSPQKANWTDKSGETTDISFADYEFADIFAALKGIEGIDNQNMTIDNDKASLSFVSSERSGKAVKHDVQQALSSVVGANAELNVKCEDIQQLRGGNALAAISGGKICIAVDDMPDEEIKAMLISACEARGMQIKSVDVQTDEQDGEIRREIKIMGELFSVGISAYGNDGFLEGLHGGDSNSEGQKKVIIIKKLSDN